MKRLYLYIIKSFAGPFLFTLLISVFVLLMSAIWRYIDNLAGRDLPISVILEFFGYYSVTTLYMAIPLAILLASIMTLGNLGERYELVAMKSAGISLFQILRPLIAVVFVLILLTFYISNDIAPSYLFKAKGLMSDIAELPEGVLEKLESLEQLRWLEAGYTIAVLETTHETVGIDTPDDLKRLQEEMKE
ncbi:MAG: LptF/LptG family permease [Flavobacteriaceae bacterium]|nr:LptF/LptG family permease [Flavobacteriaceae bacterium]